MSEKTAMPKMYFRLAPQLKNDVEVALLQAGLTTQSFFEAFLQLYGPQLTETGKVTYEIMSRARIIQQECREVSHA